MRLIRKQRNRRLYDTQARSNITLQQVGKLVAGGEPVRVVDAVTDEDITRAVLLQIVVEQETPGTALLSRTFLESLIRLNDNPLKRLAVNYLDASIAEFDRQQAGLLERWRHVVEVDGAAPVADAARTGLENWLDLQRAWLDAWTGAARRDTDNE